ncbi:MAG: S16 family serine protease [Methanocellales archaeon]
MVEGEGKNRIRYILVVLCSLLFLSSIVLIWTFQELNFKDVEISNLTQQLKAQEILISKLKEEINALQVNLSKANEMLKIEQLKREQLESDFLEWKKVNCSEYAVIGIDPYGNGVVIPLKVEIKKGEGKVLLNIANVRFDASLQNSAQKAVKVAQEITKFNLSDRDILITITSPVPWNPEIAGESGGAAICTALIAAIQNKTIDEKVLITGTIELDHTIGRVGAVYQKAIAAKKSGASKFIVPIGQKVWIEELEVLEIYTIESALKYIINN